MLLDGGIRHGSDVVKAVALGARAVMIGRAALGNPFVFRDLAAEGMALVILSSEIEEILVLCNRVLVFRDHALAAEMAGEAMGTEAVIAAMFGRAA